MGGWEAEQIRGLTESYDILYILHMKAAMQAAASKHMQARHTVEVERRVHTGHMMIGTQAY